MTILPMLTAAIVGIWSNPGKEWDAYCPEQKGILQKSKNYRSPFLFGLQIQPFHSKPQILKKSSCIPRLLLDSLIRKHLTQAANPAPYPIAIPSSAGMEFSPLTHSRPRWEDLLRNLKHLPLQQPSGTGAVALWSLNPNDNSHKAGSWH